MVGQERDRRLFVVVVRQTFWAPGLRVERPGHGRERLGHEPPLRSAKIVVMKGEKRLPIEQRARGPPCCRLRLERRADCIKPR